MAWLCQSQPPLPPPTLTLRQGLGRLQVSSSPLGSTFMSEVSGRAHSSLRWLLGPPPREPWRHLYNSSSSTSGPERTPSLDFLGCRMAALLCSASWALCLQF